ncbi:GspE/PulE family protein [Comamonas sp. NLF-1-9]|uniref:GspE/PulE family protein n=1 Tax=Comamonas sp. NLF-1-9 TaxID=2853163 RepID=UPI001C477E05|nr:ATPase, T2SS/T4P/T4SS family [Comamonas sp. NLF-1-9]QXL83558.1 Flp pilus assembly complex ATPase component TadA [Comamonas sp. NLF-1-9]
MNTSSTQERKPHRMLGEILLERQKVGAMDLQRALSAQQEMGGMLGQVLVRLGVVSESDVAQAVALQLNVPLATSEDMGNPVTDIEGLSADFLKTNAVCPIRVDENEMHVVMSVPQDEFVLKALRLATGLTVRPYMGLESDIEKALADPEPDPVDADGSPNAIDSDDFVEHLRDLASEAPVIRLVNTIIGRVIDLRASDIHMEPFDDGLHVRYRVDGVIHQSDLIPPHLSAAVSSRVKLLAHLDIAERRLPQDGRIRTRVKGRELDLRVSSVPTVHGESVVMRVLDRASVKLDLEYMGFASDVSQAFKALLTRPYGILLVTGPTGSGKTTTLYAALAELDSSNSKIITVEDPIEYQLEGVNQIQVHPQINLTFANALRSILRQDPDIIMIGEIRDGETAQIAVQSALTGHLVLSTLHTNTAAGAITRMQDMGVASYLITSSVNAVLAQRLVRVLCTDCRQPWDPGERVRESTGLSRFLAAGQPIYRAVGCDKCRQTGYKGRTGIHELLVLGEKIRSAIIDGKDANSLQALAARDGMLSLHEDGLRKVAAGTTTLDELVRVTQDQSDA